MQGSANCVHIYCAASQGISGNHIERFPGTVANKVQVVEALVSKIVIRDSGLSHWGSTLFGIREGLIINTKQFHRNSL